MDSRSYLTGLIKQLVLKLFDAENVLEHLVQLVLAEDQLGGRAGRHALLCLARILVAAVDGVELGHPGAEHRLFAQAVDLREAADAPLDVLLEDLAEVTGRAAAAVDHPGDALALQEALGREGETRWVENPHGLHAAGYENVCDSVHWSKALKPRA